MWWILLACGPQSGNYEFAVTGEESSCPESFSTLGAPEGEQTITVSADGTTATLEGSPSLPCELEGFDFFCDCTEIDAIQDYADQGYDAAYFIDATMQGSWLTPTTLEAEFSIETSCEGVDCESLEDQGAPSCELVWSLEAER